MNYRERMKEYLKEPDEYSSQYGKWAILNREQRDLIKRLLREMDGADEVIKHQYFEIERLKELSKVDSQQAQEIIIELKQEIERLNKRVEDLKTINEEHQILNGMLRKENDRLNNIINESNKMIDKIVEEVYKPVDKEWDNILCIIEDYKLKLQELKGSESNE